MFKPLQNEGRLLHRLPSTQHRPQDHARLHSGSALGLRAHVLWLAVLLGGISGCLPKTHWVPVRADPADAQTRYVEAVRIADERENTIPVIAIKGEQATYYDVGWQLRTLNLREKPLLQEQRRPGYVLSVALPTVFGGLALMGGLIAGTWALFDGADFFPVGFVR